MPPKDCSQRCLSNKKQHAAADLVQQRALTCHEAGQATRQELDAPWAGRQRPTGHGSGSRERGHLGAHSWAGSPARWPSAAGPGVRARLARHCGRLTRPTAPPSSGAYWHEALDLHGRPPPPTPPCHPETYHHTDLHLLSNVVLVAPCY